MHNRIQEMLLLRSMRLLSTAGIAIFGIFILALLVMAQPAHAAGGGAVGGAGSGGGGGGGGSPATQYGYGWYQFTVDSATHPKDLRSLVSWANSGINNTCKSLGAKSIIAYVVFRPTGGINNSMVYNYTGWPETWTGFRGNSGFPWMNNAGAKSRYDSATFDKTGYTWGTNIGWFCYDFTQNWTINAQSYIQKNSGALMNATTITAAPNDNLYFYHDMRNNGPDAMDRNVNWTINKTGWTQAGWNTNGPSGVNGAGAGAGALFLRVYASLGSAYMTYTVQQSDVGKTLCQAITWSPASSSNAGSGSSGRVCAVIPYNYSLQPTVSLNASTGAVGTSVQPTPVVTNPTGAGKTQSAPTEWRLVRFTVGKGVAVPNAGGGASATIPESYFAVGGVAATKVGGATNTTFPVGPTTLPASAFTLPDLPVGTKVCWALSVMPYSSSSGAVWMHSQPICITIAKSPKVQVIGGDLIVGRGTAYNGPRTSNVVTSTTTQTAGATAITYGSWSEYAIIPSGVILGMASGSGYVGGLTAPTSSPLNLCSVSLLSFTNSTASGNCSPGSIGTYTHASTAPSIAARFPTTSAAAVPGTPINTWASGTYTAGGTITLTTSGQIPASHSIIINAPQATVVIKNNITYTTGSLTAIGQIPQVVIIAKNIFIDQSVTHVDAWLVTTGTDADGSGRLNTCTNGAAEITQPNANMCTNPLLVDGPVSANHLILSRTAGAGTGAAAGSPAEIFNLRADAYIWASAYAPGTGRLPTATMQELPPRF